jgi:membrane protein implicated in regulation of membrane protease activity
MNAILILFLFGIVLLVCEVFVPGAILGSIGGSPCSRAASSPFKRMARQAAHSPPSPHSDCLAHTPVGGRHPPLASAKNVVRGHERLHSREPLSRPTRFGKKLFVQSTSGSTTQPPVAEPASIVGQTGETATTLSPTGYVLVSGKRYEAFSRDGLIPKGAPIRVTGLDSFRLIVTKA